MDWGREGTDRGRKKSVRTGRQESAMAPGKGTVEWSCPGQDP